MLYLIRRTDQGGGFVAKPGSKNSYTKDIGQARKFKTREKADKDLCVDNEVVEPVEIYL